MKTKQNLVNEIEQLRAVSLALYKALDTLSKEYPMPPKMATEAMEDFVKYIMEKV